MLTKKQIRCRVRSHLRSALVRETIVKSRVGRLLQEQEKQDAVKVAKQELEKLAQSVSKGIDKLPKSDENDIDEGITMAFAATVSASGIANLLGYTAKGIAKILKKMGANVDPEKEGQTFFAMAEFIHHSYINSLKKLAGVVVKDKRKQEVAANVMFGVLLGTAVWFTGEGLYKALLNNNTMIAAGEGILQGIKAAEGTSLGANLYQLVQTTLESVH